MDFNSVFLFHFISQFFSNLVESVKSVHLHFVYEFLFEHAVVNVLVECNNRYPTWLFTYHP